LAARFSVLPRYLSTAHFLHRRPSSQRRPRAQDQAFNFFDEVEEDSVLAKVIKSLRSYWSYEEEIRQILWLVGHARDRVAMGYFLDLRIRYIYLMLVQKR
jgi:hypothetical protein